MSKTIAEILADPELGPVVTAHVDRHVSQALRTYQERHPSAGEEAEKLAARLERIEKAHEVAIKANDLRFEIYKLCIAEEVPHELIADIPFKDLAGARTKIAQLKAAQKEQDLKTRNAVLASGFKPGSGNGFTPREPAAFSVLTPAERDLARTLHPDGSQRGRS